MSNARSGSPARAHGRGSGPTPRSLHLIASMRYRAPVQSAFSRNVADRIRGARKLCLTKGRASQRLPKQKNCSV